jgi:hypothetical protein
MAITNLYMGAVSMSPTTLERLEARYRDILRDLVAADDRAVRAQLIDELKDNVIARTALASRKFAGCRSAIEAIEMFLKERNAPATEEEIILGVIAGGFGEGDETERNPIFWSLRVHLKGTGKQTNKIRYGSAGKEHLIGLGGWPDSMWE